MAITLVTEAMRVRGAHGDAPTTTPLTPLERKRAFAAWANEVNRAVRKAGLLHGVTRPLSDRRAEEAVS